MVEARQARRPFRRVWTRAALAAVALASVGCTMCPDALDYSGPVPNGSSPQNDFRARSSGILPLGASPTPWPLIVRAGGQPPVATSTPTRADDTDGDTDGENLRQTVAVVGDSGEDTGTIDRLASAGREAVSTQPELDPVPTVDAVKTISLEMAGPAAEPQPVVVPAAAPTPPLGETPGWRSRRR